MGRVFFFASVLCVSSRIYISCVFQQDLESKFLEFSFVEKYLLPSVPALLACSSLLSGAAVLSIVWWKFYSK